MKPSEVCLLCTGSQGEPNSALSRMANGEFPKIDIGSNDYVIFSSSSIPGNEKEINDVINRLYIKGAQVIYESLAEVHVSGHAYQDELKTMLSLIRPKFFIPCHGEFRHLMSHRNLAISMGMNARNTLIPELGDKINISKTCIKKVGTVPAGIKLVDGLEVSDANGVVQKDRAQLATEGLCIVTITISSKNYSLTSKPDLYSKGFTNPMNAQKILSTLKIIKQ